MKPEEIPNNFLNTSPRDTPLESPNKSEENAEKEKDLPSEILTHIAATYPFLNEEEYNSYMEKAVNIEPSNPIDEINEMVKLLNNPHAYFEKIDQNQDIEDVENEKRPEKFPSGEMIDGVLYMRIPSFAVDRDQLEQQLENIFLRYKDESTGLILDLRDNKGGHIIPARAFAQKHFIKEGIHKVGTNVQLRKEGGLKSVKVNAYPEEGEKYEKPIAILISGKTFSSAERFVAVMKSGTDCVTIGTETFGGSAHPIKHLIEYDGDKYVLGIPRWRFYLEGKEKPIEETKIKPDIYYDKEDIVDYAVKLIKEVAK